MCPLFDFIQTEHEVTHLHANEMLTKSPDTFL